MRGRKSKGFPQHLSDCVSEMNKETSIGYGFFISQPFKPSEEIETSKKTTSYRNFNQTLENFVNSPNTLVSYVRILQIFLERTFPFIRTDFMPKSSFFFITSFHSILAKV